MPPQPIPSVRSVRVCGCVRMRECMCLLCFKPPSPNNNREKNWTTERQFVVNCWVCKFVSFFFVLVQFHFCSFFSFFFCFVVVYLFACWLVISLSARVCLYVLKVLRASCIAFVCAASFRVWFWNKIQIHTYIIFLFVTIVNEKQIKNDCEYLLDTILMVIITIEKKRICNFSRRLMGFNNTEHSKLKKKRRKTVAKTQRKQFLFGVSESKSEGERESIGVYRIVYAAYRSQYEK